MKTRMMWMGTLAAMLALTGCQQRGSEAQSGARPGQTGAQGETGSGGMIPESGVKEHTIGGIGGGTEAEENAATGGAGQQEAAGPDDGSMRRDAEDDRQLQQDAQQKQGGEQEAND